MAEPDHVVSAAELEAMSPQQRAAVVAAATITDWAQLPESFRARVNDRARSLGEQRRAEC